MSTPSSQGDAGGATERDPSIVSGKPGDAVPLGYTLILLLAATALCLLPFAGKAFNFDEPLFIWAARQIQSHPLDFYGFAVNWYGTQEGAAEIIKNPPIASYYLALAASALGWSEVALHLAFLVPAAGAVSGTYFLARELSRDPLVAALVALLTPVFVVSGATVMCDTMMLAWYVWALYLWVRGMKSGSLGVLFCAALLVALCSLTKYFGMSLVPLLLVYTLSSKAGHRRRVLLLLVPIAILYCYQVATGALYGKGLLLDAASYAHAQKRHLLQETFANLVTGLSFLGGCTLPILFWAGQLWDRRSILAAAALVPLLAVVLSLVAVPAPVESAFWSYYLQVSLCVVAGVQILALGFGDLRRKRDADSLLLFLWVTGTFLFACLVNWTINARSLLPLVPAVGILVARAWRDRGGVSSVDTPCGLRPFALPLALGWAISMLVGWSDYALAATAREAAREISWQFGGRGGLQFQGHWGFQYYMEQQGAVALDGKKPLATPLTVAMPANNTNLHPEFMAKGITAGILSLPAAPCLTVMSPDLGAGFYGGGGAALPFAFGRVPEEKYQVAQFR